MTNGIQYIAIYTAVDPAVLYDNSRMIWKAIYPKFDKNTISEYKTDISGYFYFRMKDKYYPNNTRLSTANLAQSALKELINKIDSNLSALNTNNEFIFPILFGNNLFLSESYPVINQDSGKIWYWVCNFSIKLNPGELMNTNRKCILMGEYIHIAFVENQILRLDYCHIPVKKSGLSEFISSTNEINFWPIYRRVRIAQNPEPNPMNIGVQDSNVLPFYYSDSGLLPASKRSKSDIFSTANSSNSSEKIKLSQPFSPFLFTQTNFRTNDSQSPGQVTYRSDMTIYVVTGGHFAVKNFEKIDGKTISDVFNTVYENNNKSSKPLTNKYILAEAPISKFFPIRILPEYKKTILSQDKEGKYNNYFKFTANFNVNVKYINDLFDFEQGTDLFSRTSSEMIVTSFDNQLPVFKLLSELWKFYTHGKKDEQYTTIWNRTYNELVYFITYCIFENILKKKSELYTDIDLVVGDINHHYLNSCIETQQLLSQYNVSINRDNTGLIHFIDIENEFKHYSQFYKLVSHYINSINFVPLESVSFNNLAEYNPASNLILINNNFWRYSNQRSKILIRPDMFSSIIAKCLQSYYLGQTLNTINSDADIESLFALDKITGAEIIQMLDANWTDELGLSYKRNNLPENILLV